MVALAAITGRSAKPIAADCGTFPGYRTARIDESYCIGCTLCIDACPVDAILGGPKQMHVVLPTLCSGCELCIAPCPVDCIEMRAAAAAHPANDAALNRTRFAGHTQRIALRAEERRREIAAKKAAAPRLPADSA